MFRPMMRAGSGIGDRVRDGAEWSRLVEGLMSAMLVVELLVLARGVA
jgi:hypothetical protein